jgi:hypothetical protein
MSKTLSFAFSPPNSIKYFLYLRPFSKKSPPPVKTSPGDGRTIPLYVFFPFKKKIKIQWGKKYSANKSSTSWT